MDASVALSMVNRRPSVAVRRRPNVHPTTVNLLYKASACSVNCDCRNYAKDESPDFPTADGRRGGVQAQGAAGADRAAMARV